MIRDIGVYDFIGMCFVIMGINSKRVLARYTVPVQLRSETILLVFVIEWMTQGSALVWVGGYIMTHRWMMLIVIQIDIDINVTVAGGCTCMCGG